LRRWWRRYTPPKPSADYEAVDIGSSFMRVRAALGASRLVRADVLSHEYEKVTMYYEAMKYYRDLRDECLQLSQRKRILESG
jgi:hypothetical protein